MEIVSFMNKEVTGCKTAPEKKHNFRFDKIFPPTSTQAAVFEEISQLVQSALDGYNACIFAYGQTGSGKTFTMEGPGISSSQSESRGMIARAVEQIFNTSYKLKEKGWEYDMYVSFMEIYNETLRDLLEKPKKDSVADPKKEEKKYEIKHDLNNGETTVTNLTTIKVDDPDRVHDLLKTANKNRAVGKTNMNARSSRSHSVFQMRLVGRNTITGEKVNGLLNLIDLAGSERLDSSGATGDRLTETKNINKSLACLGDVIAALGKSDLRSNPLSKISFSAHSSLTFLL
jgi:kinesin family protein C1